MKLTRQEQLIELVIFSIGIIFAILTHYYTKIPPEFAYKNGFILL